MKWKTLLIAAAGILLANTVLVAPSVAQKELTLSPLARQINGGNWLPQEEAESLRAELYYQRAVYAYMTMLPALNVIGMRDGSEKALGAGYNVLPIWKDRMDSRTWVPTPNADVIYSMNYLDLKETGPLVVNAPPKVIGMFTDFFQRTMSMVVACVLVVSFAAAPGNAADTANASGSSSAQAAQANNPLANLKTFNLHNYYISELSGTDESANQFWLRYAQPLSTPLGSWLIRASLPVSRLPVGEDSESGLGDANAFATYLFDTGNPDDWCTK